MAEPWHSRVNILTNMLSLGLSLGLKTGLKQGKWRQFTVWLKKQDTDLSHNLRTIQGVDDVTFCQEKGYQEEEHWKPQV
jgi:hypothetical protein